MKFVKIVLFVVLFPVFIAVSLYFYREHLKNDFRDKLQISNPLGIESMEKITIGGTDQWIVIRGQNRSNPVLLILHGGPGFPLFSDVLRYGVTARLEEHFVVVYWEQRGTAKSYTSEIPIKSMTLDQLILDTHELISMLKSKFKVRGVYLMGRSWGSVLGLNVANRYPEDLIAYIGIAQFVNGLQNDLLSYKKTFTLAEDSGDQDALAKLKELGDPPWNTESLLYQRKILAKHGGVIHNKKIRDAANSYLITSVLTSPYYSLKNIVALILNKNYSVQHLWKEVYRTDFTTQIKKIDVPVYFLHGKYDYMAVNTLIEPYFSHLNAPKGKHLIWFENTGHYPEFEETNKFTDVMVAIKLKETDTK